MRVLVLTEQPGALGGTERFVRPVRWILALLGGAIVPVSYAGSEPPPDTFKDNSQALAEGSFGKDGVFHAKGLQAKCASKYAPAKPGDPATGAPNTEPPKSMTKTQGSTGVTL